MAFLPYGYYDLIAGEESSTEWMPNTRHNWAQVADHIHDGVTSALIPGAYLLLDKTTQTLPAASWAAIGSGFKQTVTLPGVRLYDSTMMSFRINKAGDPYDGSEFYPTIIKVAAAQYDIYVNDNTIDVDVVYI
jgi:hypothetical protein